MAARLRVAAMASAVAVASLTAGLLFGQTSAASAAVANTVGASAGISPGADIYGASGTQLNTEMAQIAATGAGFIRLDVAWSWVQAGGASSWNWAPIDPVVQAAVAHGLKVDAVADYAPSWATGQTASDKYAPLNPQDFYNFVYQAGLRYIPQGVTTWEMWNEPNISNFMNPPNPATYTTNVLIPGANGIRAAAAHLGTSVTVISSGLAPAVTNGTNYAPADFLNGIYAHGGKGHFDAVGLHPYSWPYAPTTPGGWNTFEAAPTLYQIMVNNGDGALKIWGTEFGFPTGTCTGCVSETTQVSMIQQGYSAWRQWSFAGPLFLYSFHDAGTNASDPEQNFGLLHNDFTPKPALAAFTAIMAQSTGGTTPTTVPPTTVPPTTVPPTTVPPTTVPPTTVPPTTVPPTTVPPTTVPPTTVPPTTVPAPTVPPTTPTTAPLTQVSGGGTTTTTSTGGRRHLSKWWQVING